MRKLFLLSCIAFVFSCNLTYSQVPLNAKTIPATSHKANYNQFSQPTILKNEEVVAANKGFEQGPEFGVVYKDAPKGYYELLGKRTEMTKTFAKAGSNGNEIVIRSSNMPLHYQDIHGNWRTMRTELQPGKSEGIFATNNAPANVQINAIENFTSITDRNNASIL